MIEILSMFGAFPNALCFVPNMDRQAEAALPCAFMARSSREHGAKAAGIGGFAPFGFAANPRSRFRERASARGPRHGSSVSHCKILELGIAEFSVKTFH
jgi:hypothetical protein